MTVQYMERFKEQLVEILRQGATLRIFDRHWEPREDFCVDWAIRLDDDPPNEKWILRFRPVGLWQHLPGGGLDWNRARCFEIDTLTQIEEMDGVPLPERIGVSPDTPDAPEGGMRIFGNLLFGYHALVVPGTGDYDWQEWLRARRERLESDPEALALWEALEA
jgi:hypothetical protein